MNVNTPNRKRKGFVLAICVVALFVISLFTMNIMLSVEVQISSSKLEKKLLDIDREISQIGEDFLGTGFDTAAYPNYNCEVSDDGNTLTVKNNDKVTLVVEKNADGEILRWQNGEGV